MINRFLFRRIDNSALVVFRIIFGFLIAAEGFGAILTGWVRITFVEPQFTFTFIGFDWLQPLVGEYMYVHYFLLGILGIFVMLGYKYRFSIMAYGVLWTITYFMQKSSYNNHYYLLILLCGMMALLPANKYFSIDAKQKQSIVSHSMPNWCQWILIFQMWIVYTYGSIAKMYPDWLDASVIKIFMQAKQHYFLIGEFLQNSFLHYFVAYGGILFDGLIIPLLLYKPTRKWAFIASIFFHLFNSVVFQVGIFPFMSLGLCVFFFEPKTIRNIFFKSKPFYKESEVIIPNYKKPLLIAMAIYFVIQIALPLRHHFFKDDVLWTEEGHRLSWRMMLRSKSGTCAFRVVDKETGVNSNVNLNDHLTLKQQRLLKTHPDAMWQFAQYLKTKYQKENKNIEVFVRSSIKVNNRSFKEYINPNVDLAGIKWNAFKHSEWILPAHLD